jgi:hypothetical protein
MAIDTDEVGTVDEKMKLKVRKPFFSRFGFYWLSFLALAGSLLIGTWFKRKNGSPFEK